MATAIEKRLNAIERTLKELSGRIEQRPVVQTVKPFRVMSLLITGGNVLESGQQGIKYSSSSITSVPSAYDPNVTTSFIDGIGRAQLQINGFFQTGYVLVVNDTRSSFGNALVVNDGCVSIGTVQIQVGASGVYVEAYTYG